MFSGSVIVIAILMVLQAQSSTTATTTSVNSITGQMSSRCFCICTTTTMTSANVTAPVQSGSTSARSENAPATIPPVTSTGSSTATNPAITGSSTSTHPAIMRSSTVTHPAITGSSTVTHPAITGSSTVTHPAITGSSTVTHPAITGSSTVTHPAITGSSTVTHPAITGTSTAIDPAITGSSTATDPAITGSSTSTDPAITGSSTATDPAITGSSTSTNPSTVSSTAATATTINPTATSQQTDSTTPVISSSTPVHTTEKPTTKPPSEKTCGNISIELKTPWNELYTNISSHFHADLRTLLTGVFSDSSKYSDVNVSVLILIRKGEGVILNATLCVAVKSDDASFIEDKIAKDGKIGNIKVVEGSLNFTAIGVEFSDFNVKDGECDKCSGGGAGPIVIEGNCKPTTHSCNGVKPATKETDDCVTYCDSSAVAMSGISTLILGMGFLLSASLIIWE